jgi:hypothetical protein
MLVIYLLQLLVFYVLHKIRVRQTVHISLDVFMDVALCNVIGSYHPLAASVYRTEYACGCSRCLQNFLPLGFVSCEVARITRAEPLA